MLKFFFHIIFLAPVLLKAQVTISNRSLTDSTLNIAYVEVDNAIELVGLKNTKDTILFSTTNGMLRKHRQNQYVLSSLKEGECTLTFRMKGKVIAKKTFKADVIPDPIPKFSSQYDSIDKKGYVYYISFNNLIKDPVLRIETSNFYFKDQWSILSYRITLDGGAFNGTNFTAFVVTGAEPTKEQVQKIRDYGRNTFMIVEDIRSTCPDGRVRKLTPIIIQVN